MHGRRTPFNAPLGTSVCAAEKFGVLADCSMPVLPYMALTVMEGNSITISHIEGPGIIVHT